MLQLHWIPLHFLQTNLSLVLINLFIILVLFVVVVQSIGVNYGTIADDLPPATKVIALYKTSGIGKMRIFDPNQATLQALKGSGLSVIVGVVNNDLQGLATSPAAANGWVQTNLSPYLPDVNISYIVAGNEIKPSDPLA